jgi:serine/threonine protein kinase
MPDLVGQRLGDFEIIRERGRGGMGVVYEARQVSLNRRVALKVLSGGLGLTPQAVQRFRREAEAAARLHHTNIVPLYAAAEVDDTHFYAMELIDGPSLDHVIRQMRRHDGPAAPPPTAASGGGACSAGLVQTAPYVEGTNTPGATGGLSSSSLGSGGGYFDTVARLIAGVADALDYAHKQGVIHRDIKPSNLLLSPEGRLSVNDFGLARMLEQPGMTMTGEFVGTPAYMSPEQITAGRTPLDHRTDIYSLGATLYELLTLHPPFTGERREQVLAQILHKDPRAPRKVNPKVPVDLETICQKALEKDPDRRYQTAGAMAEDLRRYVHRLVISARRAGPVRRLVKWVRRRPALAASLGCALAAVTAAGAFAYHAHRAEELRRVEHENARLQLLDEKIRNAYLVGSSGDLAKMDGAITEIEGLGGSAGQVHLLRGVFAYFRQDEAGAIGALERAVQLLPDSVAARALLAMAYEDDGQVEKYEHLIRETARLSPSSPEDCLFQGYAREINEMGGLGLADMDEGIRRRDSPLGRALRAVARANRAVDSGRRQDAEEALADANAARGMVPDNPLALYASLYARLVAAGIYREAQLPQERTAVLQEAARDAQALTPFIELPNSVWATWLYFEDVGDGGKALEAARRSLDRTGGAMAAYFCVLSLYQQDRLPQALDLLNRRRQPDLQGDLLRLFLLAELGGPDRAFEEYQKFDRAYPQQGWQMRTKSEVLLFLGKKNEALASLRTISPQFAISQQWKSFFEANRQFDRGELSENAFLARAGASRFKQFLVHYQTALFRLAEGDRKGAKFHFQKAVDTRAYWIAQWAWCRVFLRRLANDETWPRWIGAKK